jgi:hypothetical protein
LKITLLEFIKIARRGGIIGADNFLAGGPGGGGFLLQFTLLLFIKIARRGGVIGADNFLEGGSGGGGGNSKPCSPAITFVASGY